MTTLYGPQTTNWIEIAPGTTIAGIPVSDERFVQKTRFWARG